MSEFTRAIERLTDEKVEQAIEEKERPQEENTASLRKAASPDSLMELVKKHSQKL